MGGVSRGVAGAANEHPLEGLRKTRLGRDNGDAGTESGMTMRAGPELKRGRLPPHHTQKGPHRCGPLFNAGLDPIGAMPLQDDIGNKTSSCSFYVKHFI